jgi:hypothetical protein
MSELSQKIEKLETREAENGRLAYEIITVLTHPQNQEKMKMLGDKFGKLIVDWNERYKKVNDDIKV